MFPSLPTTSLTLGDLFAAPYLFAIPSYQRSYSWTSKEAIRLLNDVMTASGVEDAELAEPDYFFGTILLLDSSGGGFPAPGQRVQPRVFDIVDGQQRILTLSILAAVLRDLDSGRPGIDTAPISMFIEEPAAGGRPGRPRLMLRGREQDFFASHVQIPGATAVRTPEDAEPTEGEKAIDRTREEFGKVLGRLEPADRARLAGYLAEHCHVVVILTSDIDRAHRYFTILNERGKPLLRNEILKAEVLRSVPGERQAPVIEIWDGVSAALGADFEGFFSHLRAAYGEIKPEVIAGVRSVVQQSGTPERFVSDVIVPMAASYRVARDPVVEGKDLPQAVREMLIYLDRLKGSEWTPAALLALTRYRQYDPDRLTRTMVEIDRMTHLLELLCFGNSKRARRLQPLTAAVLRGDTIGPDHPSVAITREEQRRIQYNLKDLYGQNQQIVRAILLRAHDALVGRFSAVELSDFNVEHILPRTPGARSQWREWYPDPVKREQWANNLGNLMVMPATINDSVKNYEFGRKLEIYGRERSRFGPLAGTLDVFDGKRTWLEADIARRELSMLGALARLWRVELI